MAECLEFKCGCIVHPYAGTIRKCAGMLSRSSSGRAIPQADGAELRHNNAMNDDTVRTYTVAPIVP